MSQGVVAAAAPSKEKPEEVASRPTPQQVLDKEFWLQFDKNFHIGGNSNGYAFDVTDEQKEQYNEKIIREGYIHLQQPGLQIDLKAFTALFEKLVERGLPPVFSFVYDEPWILLGQLRNLLKSVLHEDYLLLPDFWAWRVAPGQAGWPPHRDKVKGSLYPDRTPKSLTIWIPLTQAHPLNGCMYLIPADRDKFYGIDNAQGFPGNPVDIRALPGDAGDVFVWTQHLFHWGSHSADKHDLGPRMSIAFECQTPEVAAFNWPLLDPNRMPTFEERLALLSKQIMQYRHMYGFHPELVAIAEEFAKHHKMPAHAGKM